MTETRLQRFAAIAGRLVPDAITTSIVLLITLLQLWLARRWVYYESEGR